MEAGLNGRMMQARIQRTLLFDYVERQKKIEQIVEKLSPTDFAKYQKLERLAYIKQMAAERQQLWEQISTEEQQNIMLDAYEITELTLDDIQKVAENGFREQGVAVQANFLITGFVNIWERLSIQTQLLEFLEGLGKPKLTLIESADSR